MVILLGGTWTENVSGILSHGQNKIMATTNSGHMIALRTDEHGKNPFFIGRVARNGSTFAYQILWDLYRLGFRQAEVTFDRQKESVDIESFMLKLDATGQLRRQCESRVK